VWIDRFLSINFFIFFRDLVNVEATGTAFSSMHMPVMEEEGTGLGKFVVLGLVILLFTFEEPRVGPPRKKAESLGFSEPVKLVVLAKAKKEAERWLGAPVQFSEDKYEFVAHVRFGGLTTFLFFLFFFIL